MNYSEILLENSERNARKYSFSENTQFWPEVFDAGKRREQCRGGQQREHPGDHRGQEDR